MPDQERIKWYRTPLDKETLNRLTERTDGQGFLHMIPQLLFHLATGAAAYWAWVNGPWWLVVIACYFHAMFYHFLGMAGCGHELCHRTMFKSRFWNEFFLLTVCFLTWNNPYFFRASHTRHHQYTVHHGLDVEVVLPQKIRKRDWLFLFTIHWLKMYTIFRGVLERCLGCFKGERADIVMPPSETSGRRAVIRWSRVLLVGHLLLAGVFIATGQWIFLFLVTFGSFYAEWLNYLIAGPQHICLQPDVPDFRLCVRTIIINPFFRFFYANMNYHLEHHMYAAVPFYNLPKLRSLIEYDVPLADKGLWRTWRKILPALREQAKNPDYVLAPVWQDKK